MNVKELIQALEQMPQEDYQVVLCSDAEGNKVSPLVALYADSYEEESAWSGSLNDEGTINCVSLWPVN